MSQYQYVIVHIWADGSVTIMPGWFNSAVTADVHCEWIVRSETNAGHTYRVAQVSNELRVTDRRQPEPEAVTPQPRTDNEVMAAARGTFA